MACVRVKRCLKEEPADSIVLCSKRKKTGSGEDEYEEIESVFKFAGTVKSKEECVNDYISSVKEKQSEATWKRHRGAKAHVVDVKTKLKENTKSLRKEGRYKLVCAFRGITSAEEETPSTNDEATAELLDTVKGFYSLYDVEQSICAGETEAGKPKKDTSIVEEVTCNGVPMIRENTDLKQLLEDEKYVYDLYYLNEAPCEDLTDQIVRIEHYLEMPGSYLCPTAQEENSDVDAEDEDDSNDESNWRNDYPEEDPNFERGYEYYQDYDYSDINLEDQMCGFDMNDSCAYGDDEDEEDFGEKEYAVDKTDVVKHGSKYASFKARMLSEMTDDAILKSSRPSDPFT